MLKLRLNLPIKKDELLTSWVARYALSYGLTPYNFLKYAFNCPKVSILDYDRYIKDSHKALFAQYSGNTEDKIENQTIVQFAKNSIDVSVKLKYHLYKEILPKSKSKMYGLMFCPLCLEEDRYFKIPWRLTLNVGCPIHKIRLQNKCPHCGEPVRLELLNAFLKDVTYCYSCWRSLISNNSINELHNETFGITKKVKQCLEHGWVEIKKNQYIYAPIWSNGIWAILNMFYSKRKNINYLKEACNYFGGFDDFSLGVSNNWKRFGSESLEIRYNVLRLVGLMLNDWPKSFIDSCQSIGVTRAVINPHDYDLPCWIHEIANKDLHTYFYRVTDEEIESVLKYMYTNKIEITRSGMARMLGNDESMKLNPTRKILLQKYKNKQNSQSIH